MTSARVLYVIVCGSPATRGVGKLIALAQSDGWDVCVVATPDGRKFLDVGAVTEQTGHAVRSEYKHPDEPDMLPLPDAIIVAPATINTINKWSAGIADTLALGLLVEAYGKRLPVVAVPYTNAAMAAHPTVAHSIARLRGWGVTVLYGDDIVKLHPPGTGEQHVDEFPWRLALDALRARMPTDGHLGR
jgi:phosphopantothenoylcysteine synthetase/decarboxylase